MCILWLGKAVLIFLFFVSSALLNFDLYLTHWRYHSFPDNNLVDNSTVREKEFIIMTGFLGRCEKFKEDNSNMDDMLIELTKNRTLKEIMHKNKTYHPFCEQWHNVKPQIAIYDLTSFVLFLFAGAILTFNFIWTIASFCTCCWNKHFLKVIPATSTLSAILILSGMIVFSVGFKDIGDFDTRLKNNYEHVMHKNSSYLIGNDTLQTGGSFFAVVIVLLINIIAIVLSIMISFLYKYVPIEST